MTRAKRLLHGATRSQRILELGPGYNPIAPKSAGWDTHVVDHASREELQRKYADAPVDSAAFEEVDTVWTEGLLHAAVPLHLLGSFDILVASHGVEHIPDFAGFLVSAERLLRPDGIVSLALPDPRFCFDYYKPHSITGDVLEAFREKRTRHTLRSQWNHKAYATRMDGIEAWGQHAVTKAGFLGPFDDAAALLHLPADSDSAAYTDCHAWQFTPAGFSLIVLELGQLGIADWRIDHLHGPEGCEFMVVLRRGAVHCADVQELQTERMTLLREHLIELREQIDFAIAGGAVPVDVGASVAVHTDRRRSADESRLAAIERHMKEMSARVETQGTRLAAVETVLGRLTRRLRPARTVWRALHGTLRADPR
jgi:SAM-dependent methyltransferase